MPLKQGTDLARNNTFCGHVDKTLRIGENDTSLVFVSLLGKTSLHSVYAVRKCCKICQYVRVAQFG